MCQARNIGTNIVTHQSHSRERHRDLKHSRRTTTWAREDSYIKSISAHPSGDEDDFVQETPEAALVAAQAYDDAHV
jgi:hypothetical protein